MNLIEQQINLPVRYTIPQSTVEARDNLLAEMDLAISNIEQIETAEQLQVITDQGVQLQRHKKETQAARLDLARPVNDAAELLLKHERFYLGPIETALKKREQLLTDFRRRDRERKEAEERERQAQIERLNQERLAADRAAEKAAASKGKKAIAAQIQAEEMAYNLKEQEEALMRAPLPVATTAPGGSVRRRQKFKVTDIHALYKARPELCSIEEKKSALNATCFPEASATELRPDTSIPGLRMWWEDAGSFSSR